MGAHVIILLVKLTILLLTTLGLGYALETFLSHDIGFLAYSVLFLFVFIINGLITSFNKKRDGY